MYRSGKLRLHPADTALNNSERPCDLQPFDACSHHSLADNSARLRNNDSVSAISGSGRCGRFKRLTRDAACVTSLANTFFTSGVAKASKADTGQSDLSPT